MERLKSTDTKDEYFRKKKLYFKIKCRRLTHIPTDISVEAECPISHSELLKLLQVKVHDFLEFKKLDDAVLKAGDIVV